MAEILGVTIEFLLNAEKDVIVKKTGPKNRLKVRFDKISNLSKRQQDRIISVIDTLLTDSAKS